MKRIIVPTDFSVASKNAFNYALRIAPTLGADIEVLHVFKGLFDNNERFVIRSGMTREESLAVDLDFFIDNDEQDSDVAVLTQVKVYRKVIQGLAGDVIKDRAEDENTLMIIMGTTGAGNITRNLFGSISTDVARFAKCPVLLIPKSASYVSLDHILFASNYESVDQEKIITMLNFSTLFDGAMHFVHISEEEGQEHYSRIEKNIVDTLHNGNNPTIAFDVANINADSVVEGLQEYIEHKQIDLVAMVASQKSFFQDLFHRSETREMAINTTIPLLVLH